MRKIGTVLFLLSLTYLAVAQSDINQLIAKAQAGDPKAQNQLGVRYLLGDGVEKDPKQAVEWYRKAARAGHADAIFNLGTAYYNGDGVSINDSIAFAYFVAASDAGNSNGKGAVSQSLSRLSPAQLAQGYIFLGDMTSRTHELPDDYPAAYRSYTKAATQEGAVAPLALVRLAQMEIDGKGVARDAVKAKDHCSGAAAMNYPGGAYCVGVLYESGMLGQPDYKAAREWYLRAVKQGYAPAAYGLGSLYQKGNGIPADSIAAFSWFYIAAATDPRAKAALDELARTLSNSEQAKAAKIAEKWLAENKVPALHSR